MKRKLAFEVLCGLLSLSPSPALRDWMQRYPGIGAAKIKWEALIYAANEHFVSPIVASALREKEMAGLLPPNIVDYFDGIAMLNGQRNKAIRAEAILVAQVLNNIGITPIFLKGGAHLLSGLYSDPAHRFMLDLDVLVPRERLNDCVMSLRQRGYIARDDEDSLHHHYAPLARPEAIATIELHVDPLDKRYDKILRSADVFKSATVLEVEGVSLGVPSPLHRIVQSIVHAELSDHAFVLGKLKLRELLDVALLDKKLGNAIDWAEVTGRFAPRGTMALKYHIAAARDLLGARLGDAVSDGAIVKMLYQRALWQVDYPRISNVVERSLRPYLLLGRSLSHPELRGRLIRNLRDYAWYRRQWNMLFGGEPR